MTPEPASVDPMATVQALAARALLAGAGCTHARVGVLLDTSRRRIGRLVATDLTKALHEAAVLAQARGCLTASATRGSTSEERNAAEAWLLQAERDGRPAAPASAATTATPRTRPSAGPAHGAGKTPRAVAKPAPRRAVPRRSGLGPP